VDKTTITNVANDPSTIKKGLLWTQRDRFFSRWKERYFILTKDYLSCFRRRSRVGTSDMGEFLFKINLVDVLDILWCEKKKNGSIKIKTSVKVRKLIDLTTD
jgi:hypothetical protein